MSAQAPFLAWEVAAPIEAVTSGGMVAHCATLSAPGKSRPQS